MSLLRLPPDSPVKDAHHRHGDVEGSYGRPERDVMVRLDELDVALFVRHCPFALNVRPAVDPGWP